MKGRKREGRRKERTSIISQRLDIQHHNGNTLLSKQLNDLPTDTTSASSDDHDLAAPVIFVLDPVVEHAVGEVIVHQASDAQPAEGLDATVGERVEDGQVLALLSVPRQEDQGEKELRVESRVADYGQDGVRFEPFAGEVAVVEGHFEDEAVPSEVVEIDDWVVVCDPVVRI